MKFALLLLFVPLTVMAQNHTPRAHHPKISTEVSLFKGALRQDVLIYFNKQGDFSSTEQIKNKRERGRAVKSILLDAAKIQNDVQEYLRDEGIEYKSLYIANAISAHALQKHQIEYIADQKEVRRVYANKVRPKSPFGPIFGSLPMNKSRKGVGDNIVQTGADRVWDKYGTMGEGIVVAGNDTGIDWDHKALIKQYRGNQGGKISHDYHWHDAIKRQFGPKKSRCGYNNKVPCDDHGHGTHTLGTMIGSDQKGLIIGMAPKATWMGCRNMDAGVGRPSSYIECFQFFLAPWAYGEDPTTGNPDLAAHIINNSFACGKSEGCDGDEFIPVLKALKAAGILVVASAGNEGSKCRTIVDGPGHHMDLAFVVGSHNHRNGRVWSGSSRGPSAYDNKIGPHLTAPGVQVYSSIPKDRYSGQSWSGTSMASPHVAGAAALLWSKVPELVGDIDKTIAILTSSAKEKQTTQSCGGISGQSTPNNTYGYGLLNVYRAMDVALGW